MFCYAISGVPSDLGGAKVIYYTILGIPNNNIYISHNNILPIFAISPRIMTRKQSKRYFSANLDSEKIDCHLSQLSQNKGGGCVAICDPPPLVVMLLLGALQGTADSWYMCRLRGHRCNILLKPTFGVAVLHRLSYLAHVVLR